MQAIITIPLSLDFVVELRSESDSLSKRQAKMLEYIAKGTRLGWLIVPQNRRVEVLASPTQLSGEDVLPGFVLNLRRIWT